MANYTNKDVLKEINEYSKYFFEKALNWFNFFVTLNGTLIGAYLVGFTKLMETTNSLQYLLLIGSFVMIISCIIAILQIKDVQDNFSKKQSSIYTLLKNISIDKNLRDENPNPLDFSHFYDKAFINMKKTCQILCIAWGIIAISTFCISPYESKISHLPQTQINSSSCSKTTN